MTQTPISSENYFQGYYLRIARILWVMLFVVSMVILIVGVTKFYTNWYEWSQSCSLMPIERQANCETEHQIYHRLGIPLSFPGIYFTTGFLIEVMPWVLVGLMIFSKRSHKLFEFFFSLMLVISGVFSIDFIVAAIFRETYPVFNPLITVISFLGNVLYITWYCFPDGRFTLRWLRWVAVAWVALEFGVLFMPDTPLSFDRLPAPLPTVITVGFAASFVLAFVHRYRHTSNPLQRQQIKWVMLSSSAFVLVYIFGELVINIFPSINTVPSISNVLWNLIYSLLRNSAVVLIAISIAFAVLRYRLWDIDFIINRALVYGALTVLLAAIFAGSLFLVSLLVQGQTFVIAFGVTALLAGMVFSSARRTIQRFVDQRFYHIEIDYQKTPPPNPVSGSASQVRSQTNFGAYQNLEMIGRGGMAEVYKATHPTLGVLVAIKILLPQLVAEAEFRKRFTREAQIVARLEHANIVKIYDSGEQDDKPYMVMEYLVGKDVAELLKTNGKLSLAEVASLVQQIAGALDYAHAQGLVHRDIKPSNILMDQQRAVLTDFGIAKVINAHTAMTRTGGMLGTLSYIAPEQIQGATDVDGRADIYALGVMVYQMLTGELPFKHQNPGALLIAHLTQPPPNPCEILPDLPTHIAFAIQRAMAKKPNERFTTATEFGKEINTNET